MTAPGSLTVWAPDGVPEVRPGDDLTRLIGDALAAPHPCGPLVDGDVVVVTSKVVSKAEGRVVAAADREAAIDAETVRVVATRVHPGGLTRIVENRLGLVMAAAGVDSSNTAQGTVLLLPSDPDASARQLRRGLTARFGVRLGVLVTDTAGRPWRHGQTDLAIGAAGVRVLEDMRGEVDSHGRRLEVAVTALADEIAATADLVKGKTAGRPVAVVRGTGHVVDEDGPGARALVRLGPQDMFSMGTAEAFEAGRAAAATAATADGADAADAADGGRPGPGADLLDGRRA
ncbi:coenzyme F420-0:L-glutamate ligase [Cellulomonas bogoriensis]|uniref:F420-dependent oxidoreductase n=1 Tax=Cellulomonas bogoriensis 69B4 = DSM 16987 TaxID=1386082 RepID=A0A0A0BS48_9CELL|nr:coenzyme F420-0:L-glutamate ligase [Cellulomonas bogoriensis]KGM10507.1 F420-dependent oxidoreductase [Cellulomonas bogoriensis 69B4 = DSM 16987]